MSGRLALAVAMEAYDVTRDLVTGRVRPEAIDLMFSELSPEEMFFRFTKYREWDVSELSFGKYVALLSRGETGLTAIPVFPSRVFRHSSLYVRKESSATTLADLAGSTIGIPEWAQTASIYTRSLLEECGVELTGVRWVQAGVNQPGRTEKVALDLPDGIRYRAQATSSLNELLLAGEIDAVMSARPPASFFDEPAPVRQLFADPRAEEQAYYRRTGVFPIMHVTVLRRDTYDRHPWIARNLLTAFDEARRNSVERARDLTVSHYPVPWGADLARSAFPWSGEPWPYGIDANRTTLRAFLEAAHRQGVATRRLEVEELFAPSTTSSYRV
jgi:4,5-dihydroxyphthalate decarboxylase